MSSKLVPGRHHPTDEQILAVVDREASGAAAPGMDAHVRDCRECSARAEAFRRALTSLVAVQDVSPFHTTADIAAARRRLMAAVTREADRGASAALHQAGGVHRPAWMLACAALVVAGIVAGVVVFTAYHRRGPILHDIAGAGGPLPIASLTPGATSDVPVPVLCSGEQRDEQPIPPNMRAQVLRAYRMEHVPADQFELDYLITPELGGATAVANLWPERYDAHAWNARVKDQLETLLPSLVCRGEVDLRTAQRDIAANWIDAYKKYFMTDRPIHAVARVRTAASASERATLRLITFTSAN